MAHFLARPQFLDQVWGEADLDAAAEFWLRMYESLQGESGFPRDPECSLRVLVRGMPRFAIPDRIADLKARLPEFRVARTADDAIAIEVADLDPEESPPRGLGVPVLLESFAGLPIEVRFTIAGRAGKLLKLFQFEGTLVIHGEARPEGLLVKAIWRTGRCGWEDKNYLYGASPEGRRFERDFAEYRDSGAIPDKKTCRKLFCTGDVDLVAASLNWAVRVSFERFRLPGLLLRVAIHAIVLLFASLLLEGLIERKNWLGVFVMAAFSVIPAIAIGFFWIFEFVTWVRSGRYLRELFDRHFAESRLAPLGPDDTDRLRDPILRQLSAELLDANFTHLGDVLSVLNDGDSTLMRVFVDPERTSILILSGVAAQNLGSTTKHRMWPSAIGVQVYSFFPSGGFLQTATASYAYYRRRVPPDSRIRFAPYRADPLEVHRRHRDALGPFAEEHSMSPAPAGTFEAFLRRIEQLREEERRHYQESGVGLSDLLRWYLQWPRAEIRG